MRFRWTWGLRIVIDSIIASQGEVKKLALFAAQHGGRLSARGFKTAWARAMSKYVATGGVRFRENDIRAKTASDASSLARARAGDSRPRGGFDDCAALPPRRREGHSAALILGRMP